MNKWTIISVLIVLVLYVIGLLLKINMLLPLFIAFVIAGLFVYFDSNEKTLRFANYRNNTFIDVQTHEIETKGGTFKSSPLSSPFVAIVITIMLCFAHSFIFVKNNDDTLKHNPDYYVEYVYNYNTIRINVDQLSKEAITSIHIVNNNKDLMVNQPLKQYADDLNYKDVFPVLYHPGQGVETIVLNFYMKDFDNNSAKALIDYIGLTHEFSDFKLTLSEVKASSFFKYKDTLDQGEYKEHFYSELES